MNSPFLRYAIKGLLLSAWILGSSTSLGALAASDAPKSTLVTKLTPAPRIASGHEVVTVHHVIIEAMKFSPEVLEVKSGDHVVWENKDMFPHNVTSSGEKIYSPEIGVAKTWEFIPLKKGTYPYVCSLHPTMKATLIVK